MAGKIFINYRRNDDAGFTHALYQRLEDEFAAGDLFMDVEGHIKPGDDFFEVLKAQVAATDVLLVVIGRAGPTCSRPARTTRTTSLRSRSRQPSTKVSAIPVLVGGADMSGRRHAA